MTKVERALSAIGTFLNNFEIAGPFYALVTGFLMITMAGGNEVLVKNLDTETEILWSMGYNLSGALLLSVITVGLILRAVYLILELHNGEPPVVLSTSMPKKLALGFVWTVPVAFLIAHFAGSSVALFPADFDTAATDVGTYAITQHGVISLVFVYFAIRAGASLHPVNDFIAVREQPEEPEVPEEATT